MADRGVEVLTREECLELLGRAAIGRVGVSIDALPVILPVYFALFGDSVLFRTVPGTKFAAATVGAVLAFQADSYETESPTAWSVLLQGIASEVTHPEEAALAGSVPLTPWAVTGRPSRFMRLEIARVSGRRYRYIKQPPSASSPDPHSATGTI
ncbi:MAG TPA: pyridoxamine 5'-phosphate oxidase family protein [Acidimicrobiales bacterium]